MKLTGLSRLLAEQPSYRHILEACDVPAAERPVQTLIGAVAGVQAPLIADLAVAVRRQSRTGKTPLTLIITPTERQAEDTAHALHSYLPDHHIESFPAWETLPHERLSPRSDIVGKRLNVLRSITHLETPTP